MKSFLPVLLCFASCIITSSAADEFPLVEAKECRPRNGLPNFLAKANTAGAEIKIGYLGGSITAQPGWRPKTLAHFQKTYPQANFSEINAAIGGTGSDLGVFRLKQDVLDHKPDLMFVEFAVNDGGASPEQIFRCMEGIVRQTWKALPECDICFVYTLTESLAPAMLEGKFQRSASAMEKIADHYGIPTIHMAMEVAKLAKEGKLVWKAKLPKTDEEKKVLDVILQARDAGLYTAITDCGASGRSTMTIFREGGGAGGLAAVCIDIDNFKQINDRYGRGSVLTATIDHLHRMARKVSLMQVLGPNPEVMLNSVLEEQRGKVKTGSKSKSELDELSANLATGSGRIGRAFREVMGDSFIPENLKWAQIWAGVRGIELRERGSLLALKFMAWLAVTAGRPVARLLLQALQLAGHEAELVSEFRSYEGRGDPDAQRLLAAARAAASRPGPDLAGAPAATWREIFSFSGRSGFFFSIISRTRSIDWKIKSSARMTFPFRVDILPSLKRYWPNTT